MAGERAGSISVRENDKFVSNGTVWSNEKNGKRFMTVSINVERVSKMIEEAKKEGKCNHMTLTSGTAEESDKGAIRYIEMLKYLKENSPS